MKTTNKMKISKKEPKQKQNDISYYYFRKIITKSYIKRFVMKLCIYYNKKKISQF